MRIGVEVECCLIDSDGTLAPAEGIAAACEGVHREFVEPLVEVTTPPCDSPAEVAAVLEERIRRVRDAARSRGCRLVRDVHGVVERAVEDGTRVGDPGAGDAELQLPSFGSLRELVDAAIDRGIADRDVDRHLSRLGVDEDDYRPLGVRIDGSERLDDHTVRGLRGRFADRLEADLRRLRDDGLDGLDDAPTSLPT